MRTATMTKRQKRLERLRQNPGNVRFEDLRQVLEDYGFVLKRVQGRIGDETITFSVPFRRPVKVVYINEALELIDQIAGAISEDGCDDPRT